MSDRRITVFRLVDHMGLGGVQNSVVSYLRHCDRARYRVVVGALQKKEPWAAWRDAPEIAAARLVRVRHARDTAGIRALANVLRDEKIDILHCHSYYPNTVGRQAALLAGTPVVLAHFHNTYEHRRDARMAAWETVLWPFTSRGLMVSERAREFWADLTRCSTQAAPAPPTNERTTIVNVPIDGENLRAGLDRPTPELERALAECHPDWPMICSVGRLHAHKRVEEILEAARLLREGGRQARLFIAGDGPERGRLEELARKADLADRVVFLGATAAVPFLLARSNAFVLASDVEGFPQINLEAMVCGAPVVTTPAGGALEADPERKFLHVIPHRSPRSIAEAVCGILDHPEQTAERVRLGRQAVEAYDARRWTERIEAIYAEEFEKQWLMRNRPWGYGSPAAPARLALERLRWRLIRMRRSS